MIPSRNPTSTYAAYQAFWSTSGKRAISGRFPVNQTISGANFSRDRIAVFRASARVRKASGRTDPSGRPWMMPFDASEVRAELYQAVLATSENPAAIAPSTEERRSIPVRRMALLRAENIGGHFGYKMDICQ